MKPLLLAAALTCTALATSAAEIISFTTDQSFDDVSFGVESAIVDAGLVVDHVSHVGAMLERTRADVGSDVVLYSQADVYSFCSATVSRKVMEADLMNIAFCPYGIFIAQAAGSDDVIVGFRSFPEGAMKDVEALLTAIVQAAIAE
jgi:uncharacterized protein (DUF302 family)